MLKLCYFLFLIASCCFSVTGLRLNTVEQTKEAPTLERWTSGCSLIYLDVGSNVGVQIRKLFEPAQYPEAKVGPIFEKYFGPAETRAKSSKETGVCAIGFEANPDLAKRLNDIENTYHAKGWKAKFMAPRVVSNVSDKTMSFYIDKSSDGNTNNAWGSSVESGLGGSPQKLKDTERVDVKTLDLADFLEKEIFSVNPKKVVMKMDIEGSEFVVLPELLRRGYLCSNQIDEIFIEWHPNKGPPGFNREMFDELRNGIKTQNCPSSITKMSEIDDETYRFDGKPLPA